MNLPFRHFRWIKEVLVLVIFAGVLFFNLSTADAFESTPIVLPAVSDRSGYNSPELNTLLWNKLRSQFRFPKYDVIRIDSLKMRPDRSTLVKLINENKAAGIVVLEITALHNFTFNSLSDDELLEKTDLSLALHYFNIKSSQYGVFKASRSATEIVSIHSGPAALAADALEEMLNRLDAVFPRHFPGPRY